MRLKNIIFFILSLFFVISCKPNDARYVSNIEVPQEQIVSPDLREKLDFVNSVVEYTLLVYDQENTKHYQRYAGSEANAKTLYILNVTRPFYLSLDKEERFVWVPKDMEFRDIGDHIYFQSYEDKLIDESSYYKELGYDVFWRKTTNFNSSSSSEGSIITDEFMKKSKMRQAFTIAHEMCHEWNADNITRHYPTNIDESECTVRGLIVATQFFATHNYKEELSESIKRFHREKVWATELNKLTANLVDLYNNKDMADEEKKKQKKQLMNEFCDLLHIKNMNNAVVMDYYPYAVYFNIYDALYNAYNYDMGKILNILKDSPENEKEAIDYIIMQTVYAKVS